ncbi:DUF7503 family protein [Halegenticoccus tardaugens]|nr:hypothetical protein [Halegenticoccus tardaugens]
MSQKLRAYLREHPRMIGVLFAMTLLVSQAGTTVANHAGAINGP